MTIILPNFKKKVFKVLKPFITLKNSVAEKKYFSNRFSINKK